MSAAAAVTKENLLQYAAMQKTYYDMEGTRSPEAGVVGYYSYHENVPYETNLLFMYGDIRRPIFPDFKDRTAFDIACGEGRMVRRMQKIFHKVDGADISASMIDLAEDRSPGSEFWVTNGFGAGDAPSNFYDFAYCTISLQHICVFETRDLILKDICRILKPDGKMTLQYVFSRNYPMLPLTAVKEISEQLATQVFHIDQHHAKWHDNKTDAAKTNGGCDVVIGPSELSVVHK